MIVAREILAEYGELKWQIVGLDMVEDHLGRSVILHVDAWLNDAVEVVISPALPREEDDIDSVPLHLL